MALSFSSADLARLEALHRALLNPLVAPDTTAWRAEVLAAFRDLLGVNRTLFAIPLAIGLDYFSADMDGADLARFGDFVVERRPGELHSPDPALDRWFAQRRAQRLPVYSDRTMDQVTGATYTRSPFYHEVVLGGRMFDHQGFSVDLPAGEAIVCLSYDRPNAPKPSWDRLPVLHTVLPALHAGLDALERLAAHRRALDVLDQPVAAFDEDGRERHRTPALRALLAADPEAGQVEAALRLLACALRPLAFPCTGQGAGVPPPAVREVTTSRGRYVLRGTLVGPAAFGGADAFLVTVEAPAAAALPSPEAVRERHGLSKREAEVAVLVAGGLSNDEIAARLFVSRHTVRHHVEAAMAKLDLTGRGREAVAGRLLQAA
jgi:DNA-binding CsgD family transcriptional regulator